MAKRRAQLIIGGLVAGAGLLGGIAAFASRRSGRVAVGFTYRGQDYFANTRVDLRSALFVRYATAVYNRERATVDARVREDGGLAHVKAAFKFAGPEAAGESRDPSMAQMEAYVTQRQGAASDASVQTSRQAYEALVDRYYPYTAGAQAYGQAADAGVTDEAQLVSIAQAAEHAFLQDALAADGRTPAQLVAELERLGAVVPEAIAPRIDAETESLYGLARALVARLSNA